MSITGVGRWIAAHPGITAGAVAGGLAAAVSFQPSLMPRSTSDQVAVTTLSALASFVIVGGVVGTAVEGARLLSIGVRSHAAGAGVVGAARTALATRISSHPWKVGVLAAGALGAWYGMRSIERWGHTSTVPHDSVAAATDGGPYVPDAALDGAGRRFVSDVTQGLPTTPVRVFGALHAGEDIDSRVEATVKELERQGGFDRGTIVVFSPTGSGYIEPVLAEAVERAGRGDVASVTIQSNNLPSALSVPKMPVASTSFKALLAAIDQRRAELYPDGGGPRIVVAGISHGAWSASDAFDRDPEGALQRYGVDRALFIGLPGLSGWAHHEHSDVATQAHSLGELEQDIAAGTAGDGPAAKPITVFSHADDPVFRFDLDSFFHRPSWLGSDRPDAVNPREHWLPIVSAIQTGIDLKNATAHAAPGEWKPVGHEYRSDIPELVRTSLGFDLTDAEFTQMQQDIAASARRRASSGTAG